MIEYMLENSKGEHFPLNYGDSHAYLNKSWTQGTDSFEFSNKIIERSFLPGSAVIGTTRVKAREIELTFNHVHEDTNEYRKYMNKLLSFFAETIWLIDSTNKLRLSVVPQKIDVSYDDGSLKHSSDNTLTMTALMPFWESQEFVKLDHPLRFLSTTFNFEFDNPSAIPCQAIFSFSCKDKGFIKALIKEIKVSVEETRHTFIAKGFTSSSDVVIDGFNGEFRYGSGPNNLTLNNSFIAEQTGFFLLPSGKQKVIVTYTPANSAHTNVLVDIKTRPLKWL